MINLDVSPQETTGYKAETNRLLKRSHEVKAQLEGIKCTKRGYMKIMLTRIVHV